MARGRSHLPLTIEHFCRSMFYGHVWSDQSCTEIAGEPYIGWEEFVKNQEQLQQNWGHDENRGVPGEGRALLQGIIYCGVCGRKMSVQNRAGRRKPFALLCVWSWLPRWGRKIVPMYDLTAY